LFGFGRPAGEALGVSPRLGLGLFAPGIPALKHWAMFFGPAGGLGGLGLGGRALG
jgi:hypothetical protein